MEITISGFKIDIPISIVNVDIEQLRKNPEFVAAHTNAAQSKISPLNLNEFPLFHLVVEQGKYTLHNRTNYDVDTGYMNKEKQIGYFNMYNKNNIAEGGKEIKRVTVVINTEKSPAGHDTFKQGWKPFQDAKNINKNNVRSYMVEFADGTNTGWLMWDAPRDARSAAFYADSVLRSLAGSSNYRLCVRTAVEQCIAAKQRPAQ